MRKNVIDIAYSLSVSYTHLDVYKRQLISSVYSMVDMAMVGQYQGPDGTAALAVVAPVWNIIYSLGLLAGIGGCVLGSACLLYTSRCV